MEGIGAAASILQVADIGVEVGIALFKYAKKIAYAEKELKALGNQVEANTICLKTVGTLLDDPETRALHTDKLYEDTRAVSRGCKEVFYELEKTITKLDDGGSKLSVRARLQWPSYSSKLAELLKVLQNYNDVLQLMLAVLHILEGRRAATSDELRALAADLQRLTKSNENLSQSNKTLTDIIYAQNQVSRGPADSGHASQASSTQISSLGGLNGIPFIACNTMLGPPKTSSSRSQVSTRSMTGLGPLQEPLPIDVTHDHLQRCMDSVQELARTIACAMSAWQGQEKTGSSDVQGSHARLVLELGKLPAELECTKCHGRVPWSHFDLTKATSECLGTCTCVGRSSSSHWKPCGKPAKKHKCSASGCSKRFADSDALERHRRRRHGNLERMSVHPKARYKHGSGPGHGPPPPNDDWSQAQSRVHEDQKQRHWKARRSASRDSSADTVHIHDDYPYVRHGGPPQLPLSPQAIYKHDSESVPSSHAGYPPETPEALAGYPGYPLTYGTSHYGYPGNDIPAHSLYPAYPPAQYASSPLAEGKEERLYVEDYSPEETPEEVEARRELTLQQMEERIERQKAEHAAIDKVRPGRRPSLSAHNGARPESHTRASPGLSRLPSLKHHRRYDSAKMSTLGEENRQFCLSATAGRPKSPTRSAPGLCRLPTLKQNRRHDGAKTSTLGEDNEYSNREEALRRKEREEALRRRTEHLEQAASTDLDLEAERATKRRQEQAQQGAYSRPLRYARSQEGLHSDTWSGRASPPHSSHQIIPIQPSGFASSSPLTQDNLGRLTQYGHTTLHRYQYPDSPLPSSRKPSDATRDHEQKAIEPCPAVVQDLLKRWLGDHADVIVPEVAKPPDERREWDVAEDERWEPVFDEYEESVRDASYREQSARDRPARDEIRRRRHGRNRDGRRREFFE